MDRSGYKTTEFWLSLAAVIASYLISTDLGDETTVVGKVIAIVATVLAAMGYSASRAYVKRESIKVGNDK